MLEASRSWPEYRRSAEVRGSVKSRSHVFAFYGVGDNLVSGRGEPEGLSGVPVSENFFDILGVRPLLGRSFDARGSVASTAIP
jgi:hypothetical protein